MKRYGDPLCIRSIGTCSVLRTEYEADRGVCTYRICFDITRCKYSVRRMTQEVLADANMHAK